MARWCCILETFANWSLDRRKMDFLTNPSRSLTLTQCRSVRYHLTATLAGRLVDLDEDTMVPEWWDPSQSRAHGLCGYGQGVPLSRL
ncbi:hypothetical protein RRF57_000761 [Xylaria bambusicola]|uniref:Uncharacterized protein n=1 Tax=Xylaria bambusicola TaxID=326684 RepID=A0AAN7U4G2_9PEZI